METRKTQYLINLVVIFSVALVPFVFTPFSRVGDFYYEPKVNALLIIAFVFLITIIKNRYTLITIIRIDKINYILLVYVSFLLVSLFFAIDIYLAIQGRPYRVEGFSTLLLYFLIFFAVRASTISKESIFKTLLITSSILAFYGILQYFGLDPFPRDYFREHWKTAFSTFGNPNFLGTYLVLMIPTAIHIYVKKDNKFGAIVYSILLFCLLCTRTRGAWIGALCAIIIYFFISIHYQKRSKSIIIRRSIIVLLSLFIILSFNQISDGGFSKRLFSISSDATEIFTNGENAEKAGSFRFFVWKRVLLMIKERPIFGFGIENLAEPFVERYEQDMINVIGKVYYFDKAHNEYLNIAVTTGLPSLFIYLYFILNVLIMGIKRLAFNPSYWPLFAAICGYLVQAFFNISVVSVAYIFWAFLGLVSRYVDNSFGNEGDNHEKI